MSDTALNQVLRGACVLLAATIRARRTGDLLARCLVVLDDIVVTPNILERVAITRQNERFAPLLAFCRMLFAGRAPTAQSGPTRTFSLLFDMNVVFERFVAGFIAREVLPLLPAGWKAHAQSRGHTRHLLQSAGRGVLRLAPDLLLERPMTVFVASMGRSSATETLDDLLHAQSFDAVLHMLRSLDVNVFPPTVLTGALTVTRHAREALGATRVDFLTRVESAGARRFVHLAWHFQLRDEMPSSIRRAICG